MQTKTKTGETAAPSAAAPQTKDTANGATVLEVVKPKPELAERISRIAELQRLITQRQNVQDFKDSLKQFKIDSEDESVQLSFVDSDRNRVETRNPFLIEKVQSCLLAAMNEKLKELDSKLLIASI